MRFLDAPECGVAAIRIYGLQIRSEWEMIQPGVDGLHDVEFHVPQQWWPSWDEPDSGKLKVIEPIIPEVAVLEPSPHLHPCTFILNTNI